MYVFVYVVKLNNNIANVIFNYVLLDIDSIFFENELPCTLTSHSAYDATSTKSNGVKIDGFLYPNLM